MPEIGPLSPSDSPNDEEFVLLRFNEKGMPGYSIFPDFSWCASVLRIFGFYGLYIEDEPLGKVLQTTLFPSQ